jgi:hypothetical protein
VSGVLESLLVSRGNIPCLRHQQLT